MNLPCPATLSRCSNYSWKSMPAFWSNLLFNCRKHSWKSTPSHQQVVVVRWDLVFDLLFVFFSFMPHARAPQKYGNFDDFRHISDTRRVFLSGDTLFCLPSVHAFQLQRLHLEIQKSESNFCRMKVRHRIVIVLMDFSATSRPSAGCCCLVRPYLWSSFSFFFYATYEGITKYENMQ